MGHDVSGPLVDETTLAAGISTSSPAWSTPESFDLSDEVDKRMLQTRFNEHRVSAVIDPIQSVAAELFEILHPDRKEDDRLRDEFITNIMSRQLGYGRWFLFPWSGGQLVRYPNAEEHRLLRTARNRDLITSQEQLRLYDSTIAIVGLSVGSKVVEGLVATGIGGKLILADMDRISPTNLNRIGGDFTDVGSHKVDVLAKKISKIDPYIEQVHYRSGVTPDLLREIVDQHKPDIIVDEVDQLDIKAHIRRLSLQKKIVVMMATDAGDKALLDVERYDLDRTSEPFLGKLPASKIDRIIGGSLSKKETQMALLKLVGVRHVTSRLIRSGMNQDRTLSGIPQLGATASVGGSLVAIASREVLLGRTLRSGRYECSPKRILRLRSPESFAARVNTVTSFIKYSLRGA